MTRFRALAAQSPSLVISVAALFFSLGGGVSYAALASRHGGSGTPAHLTSTPGVEHASAQRVGWANLGLINKWTGNTDGDGTPGFGVNGTGIVYLRGALSSGTDNWFATLPAGNRPAHILFVPIYTNSSTEGSLEIDPDGDMYLTGSQSRNYSSLAGISFVIGE